MHEPHRQRASVFASVCVWAHICIYYSNFGNASHLYHNSKSSAEIQVIKKIHIHKDCLGNCSWNIPVHICTEKRFSVIWNYTEIWWITSFYQNNPLLTKMPGRHEKPTWQQNIHFICKLTICFLSWLCFFKWVILMTGGTFHPPSCSYGHVHFEIYTCDVWLTLCTWAGIDK